MNDFKPTHEFQGLRLEHHEVDGYIDGLGSYYDEDGTQYRLSSDILTKILPRPKPGEVWAITATRTLKDKTTLRFVDGRGNLVNIWGAAQWVSDHDDVEELYRNYAKVLNADGTPA